MADGRGGRRNGAGRPPGSRWKPATKVLRQDAVEKAAKIVNNGDDPLSVVCGWVMDTKITDMDFRLRAAACVLPYLYPRLSATQIDAKITNVNVDAAQLIAKLSDRFERLVTEPTPLIASDDPKKDDE